MCRKAGALEIVVHIEDKKGVRFVYQTDKPFFACLLELLDQNGAAYTLCGGKGICGRCRICFLTGAPLPTAVERSLLSPEELRGGIRLACMTRPVASCEIRVLFAKNTKILTDFYGNAGADQNAGRSASRKNRKSPGESTEAGESKGSHGYVLAADVGTTTIAMALADPAGGKILRTFCCMNPQISYGADVISRITAAQELGMEKLRKPLLATLEKGCQTLLEAEKQSGQDTGGMAWENMQGTLYVAANTVMNHFLAGCDVSGLGQAPFTPVFLKEREFEAAEREPGKAEREPEAAERAPEMEEKEEASEKKPRKICLLPGISAFVGGDIVAGLLSCGMLPLKQESRGMLFVDLGTNGEMVLSDGSRFFVTAASAGPAFAGHKAGTQGSELIHVAASFLNSGKMDSTGLLLTEDLNVTQQDIRNLQMAKAAIRTGIEVLLQKAGMKQEEICQVYLAGGFGHALEVEDAVRIGLLPESFQACTVSIGNAALQGAVEYAIQKLDIPGQKHILAKKEEASEPEDGLWGNFVSVNLAEEPYFQEHFIGAMNF